MKFIKILIPSTFAFLVVGLLFLGVLERSVAQPAASLPPVIQAGFALWAKGGGIDVVLAEWQKGGLLEGDRASAQSNYFKRLNWATGSFKGYDVLQAKTIGRSSQVLYLSINFERGAVYGRFVLYRAEKGWVVQNMDFSTKPEAVMPWLAFEGEREY